MATKLGNMEVSEAKRLKTLEDQNTNLKRLLQYRKLLLRGPSALSFGTH